MKTSLALRIVLGADLLREVQLVADRPKAVVSVVREALWQLVAPSKDPSTAAREEIPPSRVRPQSREGPETRSQWPRLSTPRPRKNSQHPQNEPVAFSFQDCSFILSDASLMILDARAGEVTLPLSSAVAYLFYLQRAFGVALLERFLSPEDFPDPDDPPKRPG